MSHIIYSFSQSSLVIINLIICSFGFSQTKQKVDDSKWSSYNIPQHKGYVNDYESLFNKSEIKYLDWLLINFKNEKSVHIVIVTIDTTMISKENFDDFTLSILNTWGVGAKEKNNGILIGISSGYRTIRIQNGYGIEKILSNEQTKEIIDSVFIPNFKQGEIYKGTLEGLKAIIEKLKQNE